MIRLSYQKKCLLFGSGIVLLIILTLPKQHVLQRMKAFRMDLVQDQRKQLIAEVCKRDDRAYEKPLLTQNMLHHLFVEDSHKVMYCYIPKVACSNLERFMVTLKRGEPYGDLSLIPANMVHLHREVPLAPSIPWHILKAKMKNYKKFVFVRNPFVRLISAYRSKMEKLDPFFYKLTGRTILSRYGGIPNPPQKAEQARAAGIKISFYNFIQYLLDPQTEARGAFNEHWIQMYRLCHPCLIDYDFIGHLDTAEDDIEHLLTMLDLQDKIKIPPSYVNKTTQESVTNWFRAVPLEDRRKLYKLYEMDFKLFGYRKPEELLQD